VERLFIVDGLQQLRQMGSCQSGRRSSVHKCSCHDQHEGQWLVSGVWLEEQRAHNYCPVVRVPVGGVDTAQVPVSSLQRLMAVAPTPREGFYMLVDPGGDVPTPSTSLIDEGCR
jgi:hypothetical protein